MSIAIAINIGSPNSSLQKVSTTIDSIMTNAGDGDLRIIIQMAPYIRPEIKDYIYAKKVKHKSVFDILPEEDAPWADFINQAIDRSQDFKYFIKSHDDIELLTPDFQKRIDEVMTGFSEPAGWVSFHDKDYLKGHWAPSTRPGFHKDFLIGDGWSKKKLFQFHNLPDGWWKPAPWRYGIYLVEYHARVRMGMTVPVLPLRSPDYYAELPYDLPVAPVKCHAPFNHFVLIEMDKLRQIGKCEKWSHLSLLVDEDWGLRALQIGLNNVWVPGIEYVHYRPNGGTRAMSQIIQVRNEVNQSFIEKWGFHATDRSVDIDFLKKRYGNTNITWSINKNSFDWDYMPVKISD